MFLRGNDVSKLREETLKESASVMEVMEVRGREQERRERIRTQRELTLLKKQR